MRLSDIDDLFIDDIPALELAAEIHELRTIAIFARAVNGGASRKPASFLKRIESAIDILRGVNPYLPDAESVAKTDEFIERISRQKKKGIKKGKLIVRRNKHERRRSN